VWTYLPLCKPEICLSSPLGKQTLFFLEGTADDTRGDGEISVVSAILISNIPDTMYNMYAL
jgi:hypothetical protein